MVTKGEFAYTKDVTIFVPDVEIQVDHASYVYVPLRGYSASLAVLDTKGQCLGWIDIRKLGFENVQAYMKAHNISLE